MTRAFAGRRRKESGRLDAEPPDTSDTNAMFRWFRSAGVESRPQYLWSVLNAARCARALGLPQISVVEFGVAGGNGLVALEEAVDAATSLIDVEVEIHGFDTGTGMPAPTDHRDVPWLIQPGYFAMDERALRARLRRAHLVLGNVSDTVARWLAETHPPVGFVAFDLDYYSATMAAFGLLEAASARLLPRVVCYFDDIFGYAWSDFNGERAAIADFNAAHDRKLGVIPGLKYELPRSEFNLAWPEKMFLAHILDHPRYNDLEGRLPQAWADNLRLR